MVKRNFLCVVEKLLKMQYAIDVVEFFRCVAGLAGCVDENTMRALYRDTSIISQ